MASIWTPPLWTADTVMYNGVSMDRAYSGDTMIWCKSCGTKVICGTEPVLQETGIIAGQDYVIGYKNYDDSAYMTTSMTMDSVFDNGDIWIFHADKDYPPVYEGLCEGYVTDLGSAFGFYVSNTRNWEYEYTLGIDPNNKRSLSTFIGFDWHATQDPHRDVITSGSYALEAHYNSSRQTYYIGFEHFPLNTGTHYHPLHLYRVKYCYQ